MDWEKLIEIYNEKVAESFDRAIAETEDTRELEKGNLFQDVSERVSRRMLKWKDEPLNEFGGLSAEEMIDCITDPEEAASAFKAASIGSESGVPHFISDKIISFGKKGEDLLSAMAFSLSWGKLSDPEEYPGDKYFIAADALKALGRAGSMGALNTATKMMTDLDIPGEFITDAYREFISFYGADAFDILTDTLKKACRDRSFSAGHEHILSVYTGIVPRKKRAQGYERVLDCFNTMENKIIGVICLGDIGDPGGIKVLKSFLSEGGADDDRELFYETISSIKRLGGDISDVHDPFRDFS